MKAERLLEHYEQIADGRDAIPALRRLILDLAIRGKIVPQNRNDEPASELLKRIAREKARLAQAGATRSPKLVELALADAPFSLPVNWSWSQISAIGVLRPRNIARDYAKASFVPMPMISAGYGISNGHEVRAWGEVKKGYTHFANGDVALAKITPCFENGKSTVFRNLTGGIGSGTTELHVVRPVIVEPDYILIVFKSPHFIKMGISRMTGTAGQKRVPCEYFAHTPFPLPPLAEQRRIVAKVDELMRLCGELEAARMEREVTRDRFAAATLARLNAPNPNPVSFARSALFATESLRALAARPDQILHLRHAILSLAVRGKLVIQKPSEKALRLTTSRQFAAASGMDNGVFQEYRNTLPLPRGWQIAPLAELSEHIVDCPHTTPKWATRGEICIRTNQLQPRRLDLTESRFVSLETYLERTDRLEPKPGDILYSREGGILGVACRVPSGVRLCLGQRLMLIRVDSIIRSDFLEIVLNSPFITDIAKACTTGGAAPRVNMSTVRGYPIPLPPLAEQRRIVAKVDDLMALCDKLEASLATCDKTRSRILNALIAEALVRTNREAA